ncbi:pectate lyase-like adhesive domain-containing protein, partial [Clostridium ihumii]|uniref:pectate lyase-like adhesive domain-containing protein n=1 Tax=Clostridium ihumii TaxID=1470356 RepID=UPI0011DD2254
MEVSTEEELIAALQRKEVKEINISKDIKIENEKLLDYYEGPYVKINGDCKKIIGNNYKLTTDINKEKGTDKFRITCNGCKTIIKDLIIEDVRLSSGEDIDLEKCTLINSASWVKNILNSTIVNSYINVENIDSGNISNSRINVKDINNSKCENTYITLTGKMSKTTLINNDGVDEYGYSRNAINIEKGYSSKDTESIIENSTIKTKCGNAIYIQDKSKLKLNGEINIETNEKEAIFLKKGLKDNKTELNIEGKINQSG